MSGIEQQRAPQKCESGTKQARKGYEKGMVWAWFFPPSTCTTPAPISACAAGKNIVFRHATDLPNEPTPVRAILYLLSSLLPSACTLGPCGLEHHLCGSSPAPHCQTNPPPAAPLHVSPRFPLPPFITHHSSFITSPAPLRDPLGTCFLCISCSTPSATRGSITTSALRLQR